MRQPQENNNILQAEHSTLACELDLNYRWTTIHKPLHWIIPYSLTHNLHNTIQVKWRSEDFYFRILKGREPLVGLDYPLSLLILKLPG